MSIVRKFPDIYTDIRDLRARLRRVEASQPGTGAVDLRGSGTSPSAPLPATPVGYLTVQVNGNPQLIPYY